MGMQVYCQIRNVCMMDCDKTTGVRRGDNFSAGSRRENRPNAYAAEAYTVTSYKLMQHNIICIWLILPPRLGREVVPAPRSGCFIAIPLYNISYNAKNDVSAIKLAYPTGPNPPSSRIHHIYGSFSSTMPTCQLRRCTDLVQDLAHIFFIKKSIAR